MPEIIPLRELKNASKVSILCHESEGPVFVTKNGKSDLVILTSSDYDKLTKRQKSDFTYSFQENRPLMVSEPDTFSEYIKNRDSKPLYSIAEIKQTLSPIFLKHKVKKAILFGSYVKGTATTRSDVDLVVETNLEGLAFFGLLNDVTEALRFPVDLIEKREIQKGSKIEQEIFNTGVTIYG